MGARRASGSARIEEQIVAAWKRYADRKSQGSQRVAEGVCYLSPRPCPFDARPNFETRFGQDCIHCSRLQDAAEAVHALPGGAAGAIPTLGLLLHFLEEEARMVRLEQQDGLEEEGVRYRTAGFLFRSIPFMHVALTHERIGRLLLAAIVGAIAEEVDTILLFKMVPDGTALELQGSYRRADRDEPDAPVPPNLDLEAFEEEGGFDGEVFAPLREERLALERDRDLLADAMFDGRASSIASPQRELRLPERVVESLPDGPVAILPLFGRERVLGVLLVSQAAGYAGWTSDQVELLSAIAAQAGIAFEGNAVLDVARRRGAAVRAAIDFSRAAVRPARPETRAELALKVLLSATQAGGGVAGNKREDGSAELAQLQGVAAGVSHDVSKLGAGLFA